MRLKKLEEREWNGSEVWIGYRSDEKKGKGEGRGKDKSMSLTPLAIIYLVS